ncbi:hypothetical protein DPMN_140918 [Dreissena polymorpha]|uniref:Uncharacterized protein n=1 Tax=Dreissena polymorpha TaxID=45954 RepID=A0A9D4G8H6_DREPO|nr:hypothetical protein DPMN_140918 [Dreissena polymorpha]
MRTLIVHNPESLSSDMVDLSHVLTRLSVLNDCSTDQVVAGRVSSMIIASRTAGNKSVFDQVNKILLYDGFLLVHVVP